MQGANLKRNFIFKDIVVTVAVIVSLFSAGEFFLNPSKGIAGTKHEINVDIAIVHFHSGNPAKNYDGNASRFIFNIDNGQLIAFTHINNVKNGDILNIQSAILRNSQSTGNFGLDCQIMFNI
ncbi:MAG: hypothetical protein D6732_17300 [Methanobacteriota archaeon]|nr:MAG: hypothetical protein D6732_17300 [Euryarchaeota archaeon]